MRAKRMVRKGTTGRTAGRPMRVTALYMKPCVGLRA